MRRTIAGGRSSDDSRRQYPSSWAAKINRSSIGSGAKRFSGPMLPS
jgi:hypothetical protein